MSCNHPDRIASKPIAPVTVTAVMLIALFAAAPVAQSEDVARGQQIWHDKAECNFCHGWAGDGAASSGFHHPGNPPSLRKTQLTRDQIRMTIQCGRPGTEMRYFDRFAYTDKRCYGMSATDLGGLKIERASTTLQPDEIDALADYVAAKIKGAGAVTKAECVAYFGPGTARCDSYPETKSGSSH